jgi:hypothetical protein
MNTPVSARENVNRNVEQVLILEDQLCPICGDIWKTIYSQLTCLHIICSYMVVCFIVNIIYIRCLSCTMLHARQVID